MNYAFTYLYLAWSDCLAQPVDPILVMACEAGTGGQNGLPAHLKLGCNLLLALNEHAPVCKATSIIFGIISMVFILITLRKIQLGTK